MRAHAAGRSSLRLSWPGVYPLDGSVCGGCLYRGQVVHPDIEPGHGEVYLEERFDLIPVPSGEPAADAWHVDERSLSDLACQLGQALSEGVIADRHGIGPAHIAVLRHHVRHTEVAFHLDELNHPKPELHTAPCPSPP